MFDRPEPPASSPGPAAAPTPDDSVARLCALYDGRLGDGGTGLSPAERAELRALAGVFDLDAGRPDAEVWRDVRAVVTRQTQTPAQSVTPAPGAQAAVATESRPLTLLLVEDDPETAADLTEILIEAGHGVVGPFHNAAAAEVAAGQHAIDLALLDINLSDGPRGVELAEALKSKWGVPALFLSGDVPTAARNAGLAAALVMKPYTGAEVLAAVARAATAQAPEI